MSKMFVDVDDEYVFEAEAQTAAGSPCPTCGRSLGVRHVALYERLYTDGSSTERDSLRLLTERKTDEPFGGLDDLHRRGRKLLAEWQQSA
jgi:hypothetical protein